MIDNKQAVALLREFSAAEIKSVEEMNRSGKITKTTNKREHVVARKLFTLLTGNEPSAEELMEILNY